MVEYREGVARCFNGCDFEELEIGTEDQSFMAAIGSPYTKIRCGKCGISTEPEIGRDAAITAWNEMTEAKEAGDA